MFSASDHDSKNVPLPRNMVTGFFLKNDVFIF